MVYSRINFILSSLYPGQCQLCGEPGHDGLCPSCRKQLPLNAVCCRQCALPLPTGEPPLCGHCLNRGSPIDQSHIPLLYSDPVDHLISQFKFAGKLNYGRLLSDLLARHLRDASEWPERLIPVPLHRKRLCQRGYNQSLELAKPLAQRFGIALDHRSCQRVVDTQPQAELAKRQRGENMRGAFRLTRGIPATHVALIDDVVTTGSTVTELAHVLKRSGVQRSMSGQWPGPPEAGRGCFRIATIRYASVPLPYIMFRPYPFSIIDGECSVF